MRYTNLKGNFRKPETSRVLKWLLGWHDEKREKTPGTNVPIPFVHNDGIAICKSTKNAITWIGQASFLIQLGGVNILIDPVLSPSLGWVKRNIPPGLNWAALPKIDVVLITHNHRDHMDAPTLVKLGTYPTFVVPEGLGKWFESAGKPNVIEMRWWDQIEIKGVKINFVPAEHWSRRGMNDINSSWWGGFVIERNGMCVYHSGDTGWFDGFEQIGKRFPNIHAAMLPIGAYAPRWFMQRQHIDPDEAVLAYQAVGAKHFVAMHWGTFKLSDEPLDEPPHVLRAAWEREALPEEKLHIPAIGETMQLDELG